MSIEKMLEQIIAFATTPLGAIFVIIFLVVGFILLNGPTSPSRK